MIFWALYQLLSMIFNGKVAPLDGVTTSLSICGFPVKPKKKGFCLHMVVPDTHSLYPPLELFYFW